MNEASSIVNSKRDEPGEKHGVQKRLSSNFFIGSMIVLAAILPYLGSLGGDFVFDDIPLIQHDAFYYSGSSGIADCWQRTFWQEDFRQGLYRPVTLASYWLTEKIAGLKSPAFRTGNLFLHILVCILLFKTASAFGISRLAAWCSAMLFAVHPIHTEAVIPAFGRAELLCTLFVLCGLWLHLNFRRTPLAALGIGISYLLACWSKENGLVLLPLIIMTDCLFVKNHTELRQKPISLLLPYAACMAALALFFLSRMEATGTLLPAMTRFNAAVDNPLALESWPIRFLSACRIQAMALWKLLVPWHLSHDYSYAEILPVKSLFDPLAWLSLTVVIIIPFAISRLQPENRNLWYFLSGAYLLCLLPAGNFIIPSGTIFAERLLYLPSVWFCLAFACLMSKIISHKAEFRALLIIIIFVFGIRSQIRGQDWLTQATLVQKGVKTAPRSVKTWNNLAVELAAAGHDEEALLACNRALEIYPESEKGRWFRSQLYLKQKNFAGAEKDLLKYVELKPEHARGYKMLGFSLVSQGKLIKAKNAWLISLLLDDRQPELHQALHELEKDIRKDSGNE